MKNILLIMLACMATSISTAQEAFYMANEGIMVTDGDTKILFDPLYPESYGQYLLVPEQMREALFAGEAPFEDVDAIFVSHFHGDHFSAEDVLALMQAQQGIALYAPQQAVIGMRSIAGADAQTVFDRVHAVSLEYGDEPVAMTMDELLVEAVRIPHSGWPTGRVNVENIVWRVTLNDNSTVVHMGDADPNDEHFALDPEYWNRVAPDMAFPPYWFFASPQGQAILENRVGARRNVGIHVPEQIPGDPMARPRELRSADLFTRPGETRSLD
ncbi:MAG: MBL fold metallo-hydrolase [Gammaproteobacteria bacterium]